MKASSMSTGRKEVADGIDVAVAPIVLIDARDFHRDCLTRCLSLAPGDCVTSFPCVDSFLAVSDSISASVIILSADKPAAVVVRQQLFQLKQAQNQVPTIVLNDVDDPDEIVAAINSGARGYILTSMPLQIAIEAMRLVKAGGIFVPASSLVAMRQTKPIDLAGPATKSGSFTVRETAVVEALCRGKANKIIAYELNMRESTVKVHVRNIMKKLKAKNRTEVAFITSNLMRSQIGDGYNEKVLIVAPDLAPDTSRRDRKEFMIAK